MTGRADGSVTGQADSFMDGLRNIAWSPPSSWCGRPSRTTALLRRAAARLRRSPDSAGAMSEERFVVVAPPDATIDHLQQTLTDAGERWTEEPECLIDLSVCRFHDVTGLIFLISRLIERKRLGLRTLIQLPVDPRTVAFLREFRFPQALEAALKAPVDQLLTLDSLTRLAAGTPRPAGPYELESRPTLPSNYFSLRVLRLGTTTRHSEALRYASEWLSKHVVSALNRDLAGPGSQVASSIIFEALLSASTRRPERTALVAAYYGLRRPERSYLQVALWWDDGPDHPGGLDADREPARARPRSALAFSAPAPVDDPYEGARQDARELLTLAAGSPDSAVPSAMTTLQRARPHVYDTDIPGGLSLLGDAVTGVFGGRLDVHRRTVRLNLSAAPQAPLAAASAPTARLFLSTAPRYFGTFAVVMLPLAS